MEFLIELWIPIVLTAIVLFVGSFVAWMILPHHQADYKKFPNEDDLMNSIRAFNPPAGAYLFPFMTNADMKDPASQERYRNGPRGKLVVWDYPAMGRNLGLTFLYFLVVSLIAAYIAWTALGALNADVRFMKAFRITGAMGVLVFASSGILNSIWFPRRVITDILDGIVYGILMGLIFGIFWPAAS